MSPAMWLKTGYERTELPKPRLFVVCIIETLQNDIWTAVLVRAWVRPAT